MARVRLRYRDRIEPGSASPGEFVSPRAAALEQALVAAGEPGLLPTYDMLRGTHAHRLFQQAVMESGQPVLDMASWPHDGGFVSGVRGELFREGGEAFYRLPDGTLAHISVSNGWARASIAGASNDAVLRSLAMFETLYPATFLAAGNDRVPVTTRRPAASARTPSTPPSPSTRSSSARATTTTSRRSRLATAASPFFPDSYQAIDGPSGSVVDEADPGAKWRVLILEDTGELLSAGAKEKYGQGLSRLLNVVDGLIGQGLRVLVLVTTNDELGELNAAVRRPGRCASQIVFSPMTVEEAAEWLGVEDVADGTTLAELYARAGAGTDAIAEDDETEPLVAAGADDDPIDAIRRVAETVAPEGGYGETGWNPEDSSVFWVCADWTTDEEHEVAQDAFLAIPGVEDFQHEAEASIPDAYEQVWPEPGSEAAYQRVLALARRPLG